MMKRMKKFIISIVTIMIVVSGICLVAPSLREVKAEVKAIDSFLGETAVIGSTIRTNGISSANVPEGYLFGGWCEDDKETLATEIAEDKSYYPRYVSENVLSAKMQVKQNEDQTNSMRIVSSVDGLYYKWVGFDIYVGEKAQNADETGQNVTPVTFKTKKVAKRINAKNTGVTYNYSPKVIDTESEYFVSGTIVNITNEKLGEDFYIKPFWITMDGTKVYGENRYVTINDGTRTDNINIPVKMDSKPEGSISVTLADAPATANLVAYKDGYAHFNISVTDKRNLASASVFEADGISVVYRNLESSYKGTNADYSWYSAYEDAEGNVTTDEFVIATDADLYGLAAKVNEGETFLNKKIFVVTDIAANKGTASENGWKAAKENGTSHKWTPIGTDDSNFKGFFDGQGHTISGLFYQTDATGGFFGYVGENATVQNFKLKNSYLRSYGINNFASIAGFAQGTFNAIYSDAVVAGHGMAIGGIIGQVNGNLNMTDCWFDGFVLNTALGSSITGGVIARVQSGTSTMKNCLNTGTVDGSSFTGTDQEIGGLVGLSAGAAMLTIEQCLNIGEVKYVKGIDLDYGAIVGAMNNANAQCVNSYMVSDSCEQAGYIKGGTTATVVALSDINGIDAESKMEGLFPTDGTGAWIASANGIPVPKVFESEIVDTSWYDGTAGNTYYIYDRADLYGLAKLSRENDFAEKTIKLAQDIVVNAGSSSEWRTNGASFAWASIGSYEKPFQGTFTGLDEKTGEIYEISGIYLKTADQNKGLFGATGKNATISNLKLTNSYFESTLTGNANLGGLVGYAQGTFDTIYSDATVVGTGQSIGGLLGHGHTGFTMSNCWFDGSVSDITASKDDRVGGLVGNITGGNDSIINCLNTGVVSGSGVYVGGLIGYAASAVMISVQDCLNAGMINSTSSLAGSIAGRLNAKSSTIENVYATTESYRSVGACKTGVTLGKQIAASQIKGTNPFDGSDSWRLVSFATPILSKFYDKMVDTSWYNEQEGTAYYYLRDRGDLYGFAEVSKINDFTGKTVKLANDITVNAGDAENWGTNAPEYSWISIGNATYPFTGTFDGQGYSIDGIYYKTGTRYDGFFAEIKSAIVKNIKLTNSYFESTVTNNTDFGGLTGYSSGGTYEKIYSDAIVVGAGKRVGGFIGNACKDFTMTNCWFDGRVTDTLNTDIQVGGLIGFVTDGTKNKISNCLNSGEVSTPNANTNDASMGGLFGGLTTGKGLTVENCLNTGKVNTYNATNNYGTITGWPTSTVFTNVYATTESGNELYKNSKASVTGATQILMTDVKGTSAQTTLENFDFENIWTAVSYTAPGLKSFYEERVDTSWYDGKAGSTYYLYDKEDLYGFAEVSKANNFDGMTVKLANDITVNTGNAENWGTNAPEYDWLSIGNGSHPFGGTFDGNGHTISGIYLKTSTRFDGVFTQTNKATIKNLKLTNSYLESTVTGGADFGGLVGYAQGGAYNTIYSDAIVVGKGQRVGGFIGNACNGFNMTNCWFDGSVTDMLNNDIQAGGLIGFVTNGTGNKISNCLNSGEVSTPNANTNDASMGGLFGGLSTGKGLTVENCLNTGKVNTYNATKNYGTITGWPTSTVFTNVYATTESGSELCKSNVTVTGTTQVSLADIKGSRAETGISGLLESEGWTATPHTVPIMTALADMVMDTSWYDEISNTTYHLYNIEDLYGFVQLSANNNFKNITIALESDMVANQEDVTDGIEPNYIWTPIRTWNNPFAGTFDGQGHTISGLYLKTDQEEVGFFGGTSVDSTVKNLRMENSYFYTTGRFIGSIANLGQGTFSDIYSNAVVTGAGRVGGLVSYTQNDLTMSNCWFDGKVICTGNTSSNRYAAGLVSNAGVSGTLKLSNCLNSGEINVEAYDYTNAPIAGGLVGNSDIPFYIVSCLNTGEIKVSQSASNGFGPIVGWVKESMNDRNIIKTYSVECADESPVSTLVAKRSENDIVNSAQEAMPLLDWEQEWRVGENGPEVIFSGSGYVADASIEVAANSLSNLTTLYPQTRVLKQGDIHGHAQNGGASDGTVELKDWLNQLNTLDMDFAASLDHRETGHIDLDIWKQNKDKLIYGTEAATVLTYSDSKQVGFHYNMLFANKSGLEATLNSQSKFAYHAGDTEGNKTYEYTYGEPVNKTVYGHFLFPEFTKQEFQELITSVKNNDGFFVLAHPMIAPSNITPENYEDAYLADEVGLEVMYSVMTGSNTKNGYRIWLNLLKNNRRIWATAGTDTHKELFNDVLTSIYAQANPGEALGEAYIRYLREGNFTAGSVGIQMSIGNSQMGSTSSFNDAYLEIGVGALHSSVYNAEHKYRVDVWYEDGIMYSQPLEASTDKTQMTYLRTKVNPNCKYYRVEVVDVTTGTCIAIGNPIWNSAKY